MFQPARLKSAMVASCRLPLGMPSLSLLATRRLLSRALRWISDSQLKRAREAAHRALVAHQAVALDFHAKEQRVIIAIGCGRDDAQPVAAGFALHPQPFPRAAPEGNEAGLEGFRVTLGIEKAEHQHLAGARILHDARHQAIHFLKIAAFHALILWFGFVE